MATYDSEEFMNYDEFDPKKKCYCGRYSSKFVSDTSGRCTVCGETKKVPPENKT